MPRIGVIGGSGLESLLHSSRQIRIGTQFGPAPLIQIGVVGKEEVAFLPRHGPMHDVPPHKVNYRANILALKHLGVERIIATNAVGSMNKEYSPGDLAIPEDIIDFTKSRPTTFFESAPVTHVDMSQPYCPELRSVLIDSAQGVKTKVWGNSILTATEGPRYETPAEIRMLQELGGDLVGMTGSPEVFLSREQEICYAAICFVSNRAAGMQARLSTVEVMEIGKKVMPMILTIIERAVERVPAKRTCPCSTALGQARV